MGQASRTQLTLALDPSADSEAFEVADLTGLLRKRLLELDVDNVDPIRSSDTPAGAKSVDAATRGAFLVTLTPAMVGAVVELVKSWIADPSVVR